MFRTALCHSHPPLCGDQPELGDCVGDAKATKALIYAAGDLNCFVYFVLRVIFVLTICIMAAYKRCVIVLKLRHICSFHVSKTAALPLSTLCAPREGKDLFGYSRTGCLGPKLVAWNWEHSFLQGRA